jgi:uncharacterized protein with PQ loop repeat
VEQLLAILTLLIHNFLHHFLPKHIQRLLTLRTSNIHIFSLVICINILLLLHILHLVLAQHPDIHSKHNHRYLPLRLPLLVAYFHARHKLHQRRRPIPELRARGLSGGNERADPRVRARVSRGGDREAGDPGYARNTAVVAAGSGSAGGEEGEEEGQGRDWEEECATRKFRQQEREGT